MAMRAPGLIRTPFAFSGDQTAIPVAVQGDGSVSFTQGWGPDYQKDQTTDPDAKPIDRASTNYLMFVMTQLLQRWQQETWPEWIDSAANGGAPYAYSKGAIVRWSSNGTTWGVRMSLVDNNTATPQVTDTASWSDPVNVLQNSVLKNTGALQVMAGALQLASGSVIPAPSINEVSSSIVNAQWVTTGMQTNYDGGVSVQGTAGYIKLPQWLSTNGTRCYMLSFGMGTWAANPSSSVQTRAITFPLQYAGPPNVYITPQGQPNNGGMGTFGLFGTPTRSGFTALIDANATSLTPGSSGGNTIANSVPFNWFAIGVGSGYI